MRVIQKKRDLQNEDRMVQDSQSAMDTHFDSTGSGTYVRFFLLKQKMKKAPKFKFTMCHICQSQVRYLSVGDSRVNMHRDKPEAFSRLEKLHANFARDQ